MLRFYSIPYKMIEEPKATEFGNWLDSLPLTKRGKLPYRFGNVDTKKHYYACRIAFNSREHEALYILKYGGTRIRFDDNIWYI